MTLSNRTAFVTGGSSGVGRGIAIELAREGAMVAVADLQEAPKTGKYFEIDLDTTTVEEIEKLDRRGLYVRTDVSDTAQVEDAISKTVEEFGGLDIVVNNAAFHIPGDSQSLSLEDWDRVVSVNLRAVFKICKEAVPHLKKSRFGRIINISSIQGLTGGGGPAYPTTKAAVLNLTRDLALELAPNGITVNSVCPGFIETAIQDYNTPEDLEYSREKTPLPRFGKPRDIGRACVFLASDDAEWITGSSLIIDGGWTASIF
jgi:NAD(P)-dependent dehydrogenase (short-subunit alcohol dehydrogenase family)